MLARSGCAGAEESRSYSRPHGRVHTPFAVDKIERSWLPDPDEMHCYPEINGCGER